MMASSSNLKRPKRKQQHGIIGARQQKMDWLELPSDVLANILFRVGVVDVLENAQRVCTAWHKICKGSDMWKVIHMNLFDRTIPFQGLSHKIYKEICKNAVDRSQGQLVDITIVGFVDDELLLYIADRASQLRLLEIAYCTVDMSESWTKALMKFPLLEELNLYATRFSTEAIETAGHCCPMLKTLKLNQERIRRVMSRSEYEYEVNLPIHNLKAMAIGENLHELRHLQLIGSRMTNSGLRAILGGCLHLESLDLRQCLHIDLKGRELKRCSKRIKYLKVSDDSLEDYPYLFIKEQVLPDHNEAFFMDGGSDFEDFTDDPE